MIREALIDTDILSEFFRENPIVIVHFKNYLNEYRTINISIISYYEILNGLLYKDARKQLTKFKQFVHTNQVIPLTINTVDKSAEIQSQLRKTGQEIGHTDTLIVGIAIINDLELITNNTAHFERIPKLSINNWAK